MENTSFLPSFYYLTVDRYAIYIYIYIRIHILKFLIQKYPAIMDGSSIKRELKHFVYLEYRLNRMIHDS